jgi:hypothetical protein
MWFINKYCFNCNIEAVSTITPLLSENKTNFDSSLTPLRFMRQNSTQSTNRAIRDVAKYRIRTGRNGSIKNTYKGVYDINTQIWTLSHYEEHVNPSTGEIKAFWSETKEKNDPTKRSILEIKEI